MLLETPESYYKAMKVFCDKSEEIIITTFGVFCGFTIDNDLSNRFLTEDRNFIDSIADNNRISIIVGVADFSPCKNGCDQCGIAYARRTLRIERHRQEYPNFNWYLCESLHSKVASFKIKNDFYSIIGSRNFTGSTNKEMAIVINDQKSSKSLYDYTNNLKNESVPVTIDSCIESVIKNSDIKYVKLVI